MRATLKPKNQQYSERVSFTILTEQKRALKKFLKEGNIPFSAFMRKLLFVKNKAGKWIVRPEHKSKIRG